jgi:hypothetical protein
MKRLRNNPLALRLPLRQAAAFGILVSGLLIAALPLLVNAQGGYSLTWWTVDGGGGTSSDRASRYTLTGTIGQSEASGTLSGGDFTLVGGFWAGGGTARHIIYLPIVLRQR